MEIHVYGILTPFGPLDKIYQTFELDNYTVKYCVASYVRKDKINFHTFSNFLWFIFRLVFWILKKINIPYYWVRHIKEEIIDLFFSLTLKKGVVIITTNAWMVRTLKKNKKLGGFTFILGGNPCDLEVSKMLSKERVKFHNIKDLYNFNPRLKKYKESIEIANGIFVFNDLTKKSFNNYIPDQKIIQVVDALSLNKVNDLSNSISKNEIFTFCYIAHTILPKGLQILLEAWRLIETSGVQLVVGGTIQDELKKDFSTLINKHKNVIYLGKIADLGNFFSKSHVFICPSIIDAGPTTIAEAMLYKLPVICSEFCGNSHFIENEVNGIVYKDNSAKELSKAISWFIQNQKIAKEMGNNANKYILKKIDNKSSIYNSIKENIINRI
jgi:glycosyltransferase involved in cell wall biosynthesis